MFPVTDFVLSLKEEQGETIDAAFVYVRTLLLSIHSVLFEWMDRRRRAKSHLILIFSMNIDCENGAS